MSTSGTEPSWPDDALRSRGARTHYLWILGIALYVGIIAYLGVGRIWTTLMSLHPGPLVLLMGVEAANLAFRALKWRLVLGPNQDAIRAFFISKAGGGLSPGRVGELAPLLVKQHRSPRMAAWIVLDRLLEIAATLGLGLLGLAVVPLSECGMVWVTVVAMGGLVIAPLYVLTRRSWFERVAQMLPDKSRWKGLAHALVGVSDEVRGFRRVIPLAMGMTLAATSIDILVAILLYLSFGYPVGFFLLAVVQCAHGIASAVPFTPNATGMPYLVAAGLLYTAGAVPADVLTVAVGVRTLVGNLVFWGCLGLVFARKSKRGEGAQHSSPVRQDQAALFDRLAAGEALYWYDAEVLSRLVSLVPAGGRVLDVGCGDGAITKALGINRTVAVERSPRCAELAHMRGVRVVVADAGSGFPFPSGSFDTICFFDVLHHLKPLWPVLLTDARRLLKPGGQIIAVEPDAGNVFVRWTQAPGSIIRIAPYEDEPAIWSDELAGHLRELGFTCHTVPIHFEGHQAERSVFPMWQRLLKAPAVLVLAWWCRRLPNKFVMTARLGQGE